MMNDIVIGYRCNRWTVISGPRKPVKHYGYDCVCDCGTRRFVRKFQLQHRLTNSCGCYSAERSKERNKTHGMTLTPTFSSWDAMLDRCNKPGRNDAKSYYDKGITVCKRWQGKNGFINFYKDMGERPDGMTLDRIDVDGNYEPSNCRWATSKQQARNKTTNRQVTLKGETKTLQDWADEIGIRYDTLSWRLKNWNNEEKILNTPLGVTSKYYRSSSNDCED